MGGRERGSRSFSTGSEASDQTDQVVYRGNLISPSAGDILPGSLDVIPMSSIHTDALRTTDLLPPGMLPSMESAARFTLRLEDALKAATACAPAERAAALTALNAALPGELYQAYGLLMPAAYHDQRVGGFISWDGAGLGFLGVPVAIGGPANGRFPLSKVVEGLWRQEERCMRGTAAAVLALSQELQAAGVTDIIIAGGGALLSYRFMESAFSRLGGTPPLLHTLSAEENQALYDHIDVEGLRRSIRFSEAKEPVLFFVDEFAEHGIKLRMVGERMWEGLGARSAVIAAAPTCPLPVLAGTRDPAVMSFVKALTRTAVLELYPFGSEFASLRLTAENLPLFEARLSETLRAKLDGLIALMRRE